MPRRSSHIGTSFDSFLTEEGISEAATAAAIKRVLARQIAEAMASGNITKTEMAARMHTSRAALDRLLDPEHESVTLSTLTKAAHVLGRHIRLEIV